MYSLGHDDEYIGFTYGSNLLYAKGLLAFNEHPDFKESTGKTFLKLDGVDKTPEQERVINLNNYSIKVHYGDYVPLSLLSRLMGGTSMYEIAYNGKDVFVIDRNGQLGEAVSASDYGEDYYGILNDVSTPRKEDLALYSYYELCFVFDNLRGYTEHLVFGDNNLITLGLNGLLEKYAPKTKEYLLSLDKEKYYEGLYSLFNGLFDNGHTTLIDTFDALLDATAKDSEEEFAELRKKVSDQYSARIFEQTGALLGKMQTFGTGYTNNYYKFDATTKTAYIGFNNFNVDYDGWDAFYNGEVSEAPTETDTFAFMRKQFYQAKADGVENLVIDLSTNTGGNSSALEGVVGLLNGAKSDFDINDCFNHYRQTEHHSIDINLDGKFDELDEIEANSFNFNVGILTSGCSFSCGNLLPSTLKGLGYKILGSKSGGGSCAINLQTTVEGVSYVHSSFLCLSDAAGNNIDSGVPVDFAIESVDVGSFYVYYDFFNFELVSEYLSTAYID